MLPFGLANEIVAVISWRADNHSTLSVGHASLTQDYLAAYLDRNHSLY